MWFRSNEDGQFLVAVIGAKGAKDRIERARECLGLILQSYRQFGSIPSAKDIVQEELGMEAAAHGEESTEGQTNTTPSGATQNEEEPTEGQNNGSPPKTNIIENDNDKQSSSVRIKKSALLSLNKFSEFLSLSSNRGGLHSFKLVWEEGFRSTLILRGRNDARQKAIAALGEDSRRAGQEVIEEACDFTAVSKQVVSGILQDPNGITMTIGPQRREVHVRRLPKFLVDTLDSPYWVHIQGMHGPSREGLRELHDVQRWLNRLSGRVKPDPLHQDAAEPYPVTGTENNAMCKENLKTLMRTVPSPVFLITSSSTSNNKAKKRGGLATVNSFRGMTVSSFTTVNIEPSPVVCFNVKEPSSTLAAIINSEKFYVHVLADNGAGAALADLFTKPYNRPAEPFLRANDIEGTKLVGSRNGPRFTGEAVVGALYCRPLHSNTVAVGDHKVVFARVEAASVSNGDIQRNGIAYAHRTYTGAGSPITPQQLSTEAWDPALYFQRVSDEEDPFNENHALTAADHAPSAEDNVDPGSYAIADDSLGESNSDVYKEANADITSRYFELMEREEREEDVADMEPEDAINSAAMEPEDVSSEDVKSEDVSSGDVKSEDVSSGDVKSEDVTDSADTSEFLDEIVPRLPEEEALSKGAAETDLAPGYKPDRPKDERR